MGVVAHVHHLHFAYLVDHLSVVTVVEDGRHDEDAVHHLVEVVAASHELYQSFGVVEYAPRPVPAIAFGEGVPPLKGVEGRLKLSVLQSSTHQAGLWVKDVAVVHRPFPVGTQLAETFAQRFAKLIDAPVVVGILQGACHALVDLHVVGHIAETVVVFETHSSRAADRGMVGVGAMDDSLPKRLRIVATQSFEVGVGHNRN